MKLKVLSVILLTMFIVVPAQAGTEEYGFTGEFMEIQLADISSKKPGISSLYEFNAETSSKVKAIAVGAKKLTAPVSPYSPHFVYYAYNLIAIDEWWISLIVANYDDSDHVVNVQIEVRGVLQTTIEQEVTVKANTAKLFAAELELPPKIGIFHLKGRVSGKTVDASIVRSKLLIYDAL
jgi:hypothetical protein